MTTYRVAGTRDSLACFELFEAAIDDLGRRTGGAANATAGDPAAWDIRRPLFDHLAATCDQWWIAEDKTNGAAVGYARGAAGRDPRLGAQRSKRPWTGSPIAVRFAGRLTRRLAGLPAVDPCVRRSI